MSKNVTIAEICRITGLTSKIVNDYDNEGIVVASGRRSRGYEDRNGKEYKGYKVYDEEAVTKFKHIAILRQLGWSRSDIKKKMAPGVYNEEELLKEQLVFLQKKKEEIENQILAIEQMKAIGIKKSAIDVINVVGIETLAHNAKKWMDSTYFHEMSRNIEANVDEYVSELNEIFEELEMIRNLPIDAYEVEKWADKYLKLNIRMYGVMGILFFLILPICVEGEGEIQKELEEALGHQTLLVASQIMSSYTKKWFWGRLENLIGLLAELEVCNRTESFDEQINQKIEAIKSFCKHELGIKTQVDYGFVFDNIPIDICDGKLRYALETIKCHCA